FSTVDQLRDNVFTVIIGASDRFRDTRAETERYASVPGWRDLRGSFAQFLRQNLRAGQAGVRQNKGDRPGRILDGQIRLSDEHLERTCQLLHITLELYLALLPQHFGPAVNLDECQG